MIAALAAMIVMFQGPLAADDAQSEDYIRVLNGGRYFAHADGRPFIPIGFNHNPDWPELEQSNPEGRDYDPARTERWFANLQANGVNVVRLMVETPPTGKLEDPVGTYLPSHIQWLDHIFSAARRHDVRLWVTPYDTFWMNQRKETSPYWSQNGGPIVNPVDFLTKPEILEAQRRRMKLLIDRYGNTGTIFAWEVMNEIDLWWQASAEQIKTWADQMIPWVRQYERRKWGRNHMLTISFADAEPKGLNAETAFRRPDLEFATMHLYVGKSRAPKPGDAYQAGLDFASGVRYARSQIRDNRPVMDGESGPIDHWVDDAKFDGEVFHDMSWLHLMAGGAGAGTRWPYRNPHIPTPGMLDTLRAMRLFCDRVDWRVLTGPAKDVHIQTPPGTESSAFGTDKGAILWLRVTSNSLDRNVTFTYGTTGHAGEQVRAFDIERHQWRPVSVSTREDRVRVELPAGVDEVALFTMPHFSHHSLAGR